MPVKKILLFGASGQLGQAWKTYLHKDGIQNMQFIPYGSAELDITNFRLVEEEIRRNWPDILINCAAYTRVDRAEEEREKSRRINTDAVKNIAECCKKYDATLVHFSTDYIFGGLKEDRDRFPHGYPEDHPADPANWYGQTKWEGEQAIRHSGCRHLIMRISWLCGLHGSNFVKTMLKLAKTHSTLKVVDDQFGSPTFADQLVKNSRLMIEKERQGTYHCTSQGTLSWADLAEAIFERIDEDITVQRIPTSAYPTEAARPFYSKLNTRKIEQIEGIQIENWQTELTRLLEKLAN